MTPNETESYKRKLRAIISPLAPPCQKLRNPMMVRSWKWRDFGHSPATPPALSRRHITGMRESSRIPAGVYMSVSTLSPACEEPRDQERTVSFSTSACSISF